MKTLIILFSLLLLTTIPVNAQTLQWESHTITPTDVVLHLVFIHHQINYIYHLIRNYPRIDFTVMKNYKILYHTQENLDFNDTIESRLLKACGQSQATAASLQTIVIGDRTYTISCPISMNYIGGEPFNTIDIPNVNNPYDRWDMFSCLLISCK